MHSHTGWRRHHRMLPLALLLLMLPFLFVQCSRTESRESGLVTITYWPSTNPYEIELAREMASQWNAVHPDTQVVVQPLPEGRSGEEVLIIAAAGGTAPDICSNVGPVIVPLLAKAGALIPVDRFPGARDFMESRLPEGMISGFVGSDDSLYQIPWKGNPILVQYNDAILREGGFDRPPRTWSEWDTLAARISGDTDGDGRDDRWMADINIVAEWRQRLFDFYAFYIAASGGKTLLTPDGKVDFNNPVAVKVFDFFANGFKKGYYANSIWVGDVFLQGKMAAHVTGPWNIAHTEHMKPEGFEYSFGPIPVPDEFEGKEYTFGDPKSIGIFTTSKHPQAAWNFVHFMLTRQSDLRLLQITNQLPLRRNLLSDSLFVPYFQTNPMMVQFADHVSTTRGFDQNTALQEVFDAVCTSFEAACILGRWDLQMAVEKAGKRSEHLLSLRGS